MSGNRILTSIKGHNSVTKLRKVTGNNPDLDLVHIRAYTKVGQTLSICFEDIQRKQNSDTNVALFALISYANCECLRCIVFNKVLFCSVLFYYK